MPVDDARSSHNLILAHYALPKLPLSTRVSHGQPSLSPLGADCIKAKPSLQLSMLSTERTTTLRCAAPNCTIVFADLFQFLLSLSEPVTCLGWPSYFARPDVAPCVCTVLDTRVSTPATRFKVVLSYHSKYLDIPDAPLQIFSRYIRTTAPEKNAS